MPPSNEPALRDSLVRTLCELIAIPSTTPPGDTSAIMRYAQQRLTTIGYDTHLESRRAGVHNVVARLGRGAPSLVFNAHADTVGPGERGLWRTDPFAASVTQDRVYGLGACNCKGSMAVQLWLAEEIARRGGPKTGEIVFTFVGDEEAFGSDGTKFLRDQGLIKPGMLVVGAPTANQLITEERGVFQAQVVAHGRPAHAGEPQHGDNAILRMTRIIASLDRGLASVIADRAKGGMQSTINIGTIGGGTTANVVPSRCAVEIDRRLLAGETVKEAFAELRTAVAAAGEPAGTWDIELTTGTNGFAARRDSRLVAAFTAAYSTRAGAQPRFIIPIGASDARFFADDGIEILVTGPGEGSEGHAANESVTIRDLVDAAHIHLGAVERLVPLAKD